MRILKNHPLISLANGYLVDSPQPSNISYLWNFGSLLGFCLVIQIVTGVTLAMHYNPSVLEAFNSVEHIMRDVNNGWLIRYLHSNTASAFFFLVYLHIGRGLYYGSYRAPRTLVWTIGTVIFILMMATAFLGYVLPYGVEVMCTRKVYVTTFVLCFIFICMLISFHTENLCADLRTIGFIDYIIIIISQTPPKPHGFATLPLKSDSSALLFLCCLSVTLPFYVVYASLVAQPPLGEAENMILSCINGCYSAKDLVFNNQFITLELSIPLSNGSVLTFEVMANHVFYYTSEFGVTLKSLNDLNLLLQTGSCDIAGSVAPSTLPFGLSPHAYYSLVTFVSMVGYGTVNQLAPYIKPVIFAVDKCIWWILIQAHFAGQDKLFVHGTLGDLPVIHQIAVAADFSVKVFYGILADMSGQAVNVIIGGVGGAFGNVLLWAAS